MAKGQLPKAYLRIDPNIDSHADPGAIVILMAWANRQWPRGRLKDLHVIQRLIGKKRTSACIERGDIVLQDDGTYYLSGWDEWQEGDYTVGDRMRLLRERSSTPGRLRTTNWRLRTAVFERDSYRCRYCADQEYERHWLVADHVIPQPDGPTTLENLVTCCRSCNKKKGGRTPEQAGMVLLPVPFLDVTRHGDTSQVASSSETTRRQGVKASRQERTTTAGAVAPPPSAEPPPTPATPEQAALRAKAVLGEPPNGNGAPKKRPPTWLTPFGDAWRERWGEESEPPWGEMAQAFARPAREMDHDELLSRWVRFLAAAERSEWARPTRFIQGLGQWAEGGRPPARAGPDKGTVNQRSLGALERFVARRTLDAEGSGTGDSVREVADKARRLAPPGGGRGDP